MTTFPTPPPVLASHSLRRPPFEHVLAPGHIIYLINTVYIQHLKFCSKTTGDWSSGARLPLVAPLST